MFFNVSGYITYISDSTIKIKIIDKDDLIKFQRNINKLYKKNIDTDNNTNIYNFKINKKTKFIIKNYTYNNYSELIGIFITISGYSKYYCFSINNNILNEINNELEDEKKYKQGYIYICNKIYN